jgi:hypothetical protein
LFKGSKNLKFEIMDKVAEQIDFLVKQNKALAEQAANLLGKIR